MTDEIRRAVGRKLKQAKLEPDALQKPDAQIVVKGADGTMHVLVPKAAPIDRMDAKVQGAPGVKLTVEEHDEVDLGPELGGEWKNFAVSGFDQIAPQAAGAARAGSVALLAQSDALAGKDWVPFTSIDLGLLVDMMRDPKADVLVRPIPAGARDGARFIEVTPDLRRLVGATLGRHVDTTITDDVLNNAIAALQKQNFEMQRWIAVASGLDLPIVSKKAPTPAAAPVDDAGPEAAGPLAAATAKWLDDNGHVVSDAPTADDLGALLDALPDDVPEEVAADVRTAWVTAQDTEAVAGKAELDDLFGDFADAAPAKDAVDAAPAAKVIAGDADFAAARTFRYGQVKEGLAPLGVDEATVRKLADLVNLASTPSNKPALVIIAGRSKTPADTAMDLARAITARGAVTIGGEELAKPGFGPVFGHNNGVPTMSEAVLSESSLQGGRTGGRKVAIVVDDLTAVGAACPDEDTKQATLVDWLKTVAVTMETGYTKTYSDDAHQKVPLGESVWLQRWPGDAADLHRVIDAHPDLHVLKRFVVSIESTSEQNVKQLEQSLADQARTVADAKVEIGPDLKARLVEAFDRASTPAEAAALVEQRIAEAVLQAAAVAPASSYVVDFNSRMLTTKDKDRLMSGRPLLGVDQPYSVTARIDDEPYELQYGRQWTDVKGELESLRAQNAALSAENATLRSGGGRAGKSKRADDGT